MDWFLYNNGLRHEKVKRNSEFLLVLFPDVVLNFVKKKINPGVL